MRESTELSKWGFVLSTMMANRKEFPLPECERSGRQWGLPTPASPTMCPPVLMAVFCDALHATKLGPAMGSWKSSYVPLSGPLSGSESDTLAAQSFWDLIPRRLTNQKGEVERETSMKILKANASKPHTAPPLHSMAGGRVPGLSGPPLPTGSLTGWTRLDGKVL